MDNKNTAEKLDAKHQSVPRRNVKIIHHPFAEEKPQKLMVAAYVRVSTDMSDQLNSFSAQLKHYKSFIAENEEWEMADIYADEGISGTSTLKRHEFQRMMVDCRKGKIQRVLTKSISRFCRNTKDCLEAVRELTALGVTVLFEKEGIDTATMGNELFLAAMSDFAQNESLSMSGNLRKGIRMRMAQGTYIPSAAPLGYEWENGVLEIKEDEAETVRWIFEQFLSGIGPDRIALELSKKQAKRKNSETGWSIYAVRYILTNERYVGNMLLQKNFNTDTLPFKKMKNEGQVEQYLVLNSHTPIIDKATYDRVQKLIEERRERNLKGEDGSHVFRNRIYCGKCGCTYRLKSCGEKRYWSCRTHDRDASLCGAKRIPEHELECVFIRCYSKLKLHNKRIIAPMIEQLYALKRNISLNNPDVMRLNDDVLALNEQNAVFAGLAARGIWDNQIYHEKKAINDRKIQKLQAEKSKLHSHDTLDDRILQSKNIQQVLDKGPVPHSDFNHDVFDKLVEKIIISGDTDLKIRLKNSLELTECYERPVR